MNIDDMETPLDRAELHARWKAQLAEINRLEVELASMPTTPVERPPSVSRRTLLKLAAGGAAAATIGVMSGATPAFAGDLPFIGSIEIFAGNFAPQGWAFCDGALLAISENDTLFSLIGTAYGGDGQTTFGLPDLRGRVPIGPDTGSVNGTFYDLGQSGGTENVTLNVQQLPAHTHPALAHSGGGNSASPTNAYWAGSTTGDKAYGSTVHDVTMNPGAISNAGGSQPHDNLQPCLALNFIIALYGIYPTQT